MLKEVVRNTLAALAGALTGMVLIMLIQALNRWVYPVPAGVTPANKEAFLAYLQAAPLAALLVVLASYLVGVTAGAWVAGRLSFNYPARQAIMVVALYFVGSVMNLLSFPHPAWFWVANLAVVLGAGWLALKLQPAPAAPAA